MSFSFNNFERSFFPNAHTVPEKYNIRHVTTPGFQTGLDGAVEDAKQDPSEPEAVGRLGDLFCRLRAESDEFDGVRLNVGLSE